MAGQTRAGSATPHLPEGQRSSAAFDMHGRACRAAAGAGSALAVARASRSQGDGSAQAEVALADDGAAANNRDFILDYRLAGERIESG